TVPTTSTTKAPGPTSDLSAAGFGPGVEEAPFYPDVSIGSVSCGPSPTGGFVEIQLPPGGAGTTAGSALTEATTVVVVAGRAEVKDHTGKVLYADAEPTITVARHGDLALSMPNATDIGGDQRPVDAGAINVSGSYNCPDLSVAFPGV
ncbi:MAG TPA: hypothetical protein VNY84_12460, partial [Acidimicrobiales bacterium]|nr:hypothetical protein [Acidimicrobiales bacterium]